jgi:hypothetical protein
MKIGVAGAFHNIAGGVRVGDVVEIDDDNARRSFIVFSPFRVFLSAGPAERVLRFPPR